jgi:hypothetical protein
MADAKSARAFIRCASVIGLIDFIIMASILPSIIYGTGIFLMEPFQNHLSTILFLFTLLVLVLGPIFLLLGLRSYNVRCGVDVSGPSSILVPLLVITLIFLVLAAIPKKDYELEELLCFGNLLFPVHFLAIFGTVEYLMKRSRPEVKRYNIVILFLLFSGIFLGALISFDSLEVYFFSVPLLFILMLIYKVTGSSMEHWSFLSEKDNGESKLKTGIEDYREASSKIMVAGILQSIIAFLFLILIIFIAGVRSLTYVTFLAVIWLLYVPSAVLFAIFLVIRPSKDKDAECHDLKFFKSYLSNKRTQRHFFLFQTTILLGVGSAYGLSIFMTLKNGGPPPIFDALHIVLFTFFIGLILVHLPHSLIFIKGKGGYDRSAILYSMIMFLMGVFFLLMVTTDIVLFKPDLYHEYVETNPGRISLFFAVLPICTIVPSLLLKAGSLRKIMTLTSFAIVSTVIMALTAHYVFTYEKGSSLLNISSFLLFILPLSLLIIIGWTLEGGRREKRKLLDLRWLIKGTFTRPVITILVIVSSILLAYISAYATWTSYDIRSHYPDGDDYSYVRSYLDKNISSLVGEERFMNGNIYDPNVLNLSDLRYVERKMKDMRSKNEWGHHHLEILVSLKRNISLSVEAPVQDQVDQERYHGTYIRMNITINGHKFDMERNKFAYLDHEGKVSNLNSTGKWGFWREDNVSVSMDDLDLIEIDLDIGVQSAPLAGYGGDFHQWVTVRDGKIVFILATRDNWVS